MKLYRWWTVFGWWETRDRGLKLGPVTVCWFLDIDGRWRLAVTALGDYTIYDSYVRDSRMRRR